MERKNLISIIIIDALVMVIALGLIIYRYTILLKTTAGQVTVKSVMSENRLVPKVNEQLESSVSNLEEPGNTDIEKSSHRNIGFSFRHSRVDKVEIIGDFNDWIPQALTKGDNHTWKITVPLAPGEYAYNFVVDGKPIKDPANPKVCNVGRGFTNSFLKVKPLNDDKKGN